MATKTMNISVGDELASYVASQVGSGLYTNYSEVVREALREHKERREARRRAIEQVDHELEVGLEEVRQGRTVSAQESLKRARAAIDRAALD